MKCHDPTRSVLLGHTDPPLFRWNQIAISLLDSAHRNYTTIYAPDFEASSTLVQRRCTG